MKENSEPPSTRKKLPNDRNQLLFSKAKILGLVFLAAVLLTVYLFLDQRVFAPNRPLIWQTFEPIRISKDIREDRIVVIVTGDFKDAAERARHADYINVPVVRAEAHRQRTVFTVLPIGADEKYRDNRLWLEEQIKELPEPDDFNVIVFSRRATSPKILDSNLGVGEKLAEWLKAIRLNDFEKQ